MSLRAPVGTSLTALQPVLAPLGPSDNKIWEQRGYNLVTVMVDKEKNAKFVF